MESVHRRPAPALRPLVAFYSGYRQVGAEPGRHRGLPSRGFSVSDPEGNRWSFGTYRGEPRRA
ncbi:MAG: hypothetical protein E6J41_29675 [Chloroflexi bacterium]|nr:MAG: hypothetical protein E6J41_29675 [Chloroflexota bacterium]